MNPVSAFNTPLAELSLAQLARAGVVIIVGLCALAYLFRLYADVVLWWRRNKPKSAAQKREAAAAAANASALRTRRSDIAAAQTVTVTAQSTTALPPV